MHQIWTNPSLQRSIVQLSGYNAELINCLKLSRLDSLVNADHSIFLVPNMEYIFTYIDPDTGMPKSIKALTEAFYEDCIKVKYLDESKNEVCHKCPNRKATTIGPVKKCSCILNPITISKYNGPQVFFIPIANLINVTHVTTDKYNGEVRVMLLGISAEVVKAIIIRMAIFDDKVEDAVRNVTLEVGKTYDFTYVSGNNIRSTRAKVVNIEEVEGCICSRPGNDYVREHIGAHNSVYVNFNDATKEEFMHARPAKKVKIVVDVSNDESGIYETIMLDCIRDCTLSDGSTSDSTTDNEDPICRCCPHAYNGCNPCNCGHHDGQTASTAYIENDELVIR